MIKKDNELVELVSDWLNSAELKDFKKIFLSTEFADLISYHSTFGREIRNKYNLWMRRWIPELEDGVDVSPNHPDALSMKIIENVWLLNHSNEKGNSNG